MMDFDALIVGGGVAGSATALELLAAGWRVGILHRHDSVCGVESLSPAAAQHLERLSIRTGSRLAEVVAWWGSDEVARARPLDARVVERSELATALRVRATEHGAVIIDDASVLQIERLSNGMRVEYRGHRGEREVIAKFLVDATGRSSVVGRRFGAHRVDLDQLFCISVPVHEPHLVGTWTESAPDGWWNLCCLSEQGTLSFYSTAGSVRGSKRDIARGSYETRHLRQVLPAPVFGNSIVRPSDSSRLVPCAGPGWVAVGDAAFTVQPLASAGVAKALRDARLARWALEHDPRNYEAFQLSELNLYLRQLAQHYALENRWPASPFWQAANYPSTPTILRPGVTFV